MTLAKREKILLAITLVSIFVGLYQFGYKSFLKKRLNVAQLLVVAKTEVINQSRVLEGLNANRSPSSVVTEIETVEEELEQAIADNSASTKIVEEVIRTAKLNQVDVLKLTADGTDVLDAFVRTKYRMQMRASYVALGHLLEALETSPLMIEVESLEMVRDGSDLRQVIMNARINSYVSDGD
jgi:hypothetical protein